MVKAVIAAVAVMALVVFSFSSTAEASPIDVHQINAQILVDTNYTDGYRGYLTEEFPTGVISDRLIITARSPGNSTLSLEVNGTYVFSGLYFDNITTQKFTIKPSANATFVITIHSYELNYTRILTYHGVVYTPVQFITYEENLYKKSEAVPHYTLLSVLDAIVSAVLGTFAFTTISFYAQSWIRSRKTVDDGGD